MMKTVSSFSTAGRPLSATSTDEQPAQLQLTSLVDMMVILVVFLLQSFSAEGQLIAPAAGLELPASQSGETVPLGLVVEVGPQRIVVGGRDVLPTAALASADTMGLAVLTAALAAISTENEQPQVLVQADRHLAYTDLSQVMRACAQAGWSDVSLVVLQGES